VLAALSSLLATSASWSRAVNVKENVMFEE
jgi:hypothetical protein